MGKMGKGLFMAAITMAMLLFLAGMAFGSDLSELIRVTRNDMTLQVNQTKVTADRFLYKGTTYVPLREVATLLGKEVGWNALTRVASISDPVYQKVALAGLLPSAVGTQWTYSGFAEYGHVMTLASIADEPAKRTYLVNGMVDDMSDGANSLDFSIKLQYILERNSLIQQKTEYAMMDSKYNRLTLIRTPLEAGNFWTESVTDENGNRKEISSQITKMETIAGGLREYTVRTSEKGGQYYEQRVLREGTGVVAFEKLFELGEDSFSSGYFLYQPDKIVNVNITLYFPKASAEKVIAEVRNVPVDNARTAWAAMKELVAGPRKAGLYPSMPVGTAVLDLAISKGTCTVNFSREFLTNHGGGSAGEMMTLGSIVNTLTEFPSVQRVMILVEGKAGETLGNILLDKPLTRMTDLIGR